MVVQPTLTDVAAICYRRKWTILLVTLLFCAAGAAYLATATPRYRSDTSLVIRFGRSAGPSINVARDTAPSIMDSAERRELIQAHADILTSPDVARTVISKVGLDQLYPTLAAHPPATGTTMDAAVNRFNTDLNVTPELSGDVLRLSFLSRDPRLSQSVLDVLVEEYIRLESEIFSDTTYAFQKAQADLAFKRLVAAQNRLAAFKSATGVSDFDTQMAASIRQQSDLRSRLNKGEVDLAEASAKKQALDRIISTLSPQISNTAGSRYSAADDAQARLNELRAKQQDLIATHGADWPAARAMQASIAEAQAAAAASSAAIGSRRETHQNDIYQAVQTNLLRATAEAQSGTGAVTLMTDQVNELNKQIADLESRHAELLSLQREVEIDDKAYRAIALHLVDSRIGVDKSRDGLSRVAVITQPTLPYVPSSPRYRIISLVSALAGVIAGLVVAFALELRDNRFLSGRQLSARLRVPVLASFEES